MDELAVALKVDPVELRLRYYSDRDQTDDLPFQARSFANAMSRAPRHSVGIKRKPTALHA